jgi:uncharacterized protein YhfF
MQFLRGSENDPSNDLESERRFSLADELSTLVRQGIKTATCSALLRFRILEGAVGRSQRAFRETGRIVHIVAIKGSRVSVERIRAAANSRLMRLAQEMIVGGAPFSWSTSTGATASHHCKVSSVAPFRQVE